MYSGEIQVHTILNHAFSEAMHDILYKKPTAPGFGNQFLTSIDKKFQAIMKDFLLPAGYEFQKIAYDYNRLIQGKEIFEKDLKDEVINTENNNDRHELLKKYMEYVLPLIDKDHLVTILPDIMKSLLIAINKAKSSTPLDIDTPFGSIKGKQFNDILKICLDILNNIRYVNIDSSLSTIIRILSEVSQEEQSLVIESAKKLADYNLDVLKVAGYHVQKTIIDKISTLDNDFLIQHSLLVNSIFESILQPTAEGFASTYRTISFSQSSLVENEELKMIRHDSIKLLKRIYQNSNSSLIKRNILNTFSVACKTPSNVNYTDNLFSLIIADTNEIIDFYYDVALTEPYDILSSQESDVLFYYKRAKHALNEGNTNGICVTLSKATLEKIERYRSQINTINEYVICKILIGQNSVFDHSWDGETYQFSDEQKYRDKKIQEFSISISEKNSNFWKEIILLCAQYQSKNPQRISYFLKFLYLVAEKNPDFIFLLLNNHENELLPFLTDMFEGLLMSSKSRETIELIDKWIEAGNHLQSCAMINEFYNNSRKTILEKIFNKALIAKDETALIAIMTNALKNSNDENEYLISDLFFRSLNELTKFNNSKWIHNICFSREYQKIIGITNDKNLTKVLENLLILQQINNEVEYIILPIAQREPQKVIDFFGIRLTHQRNKKLDELYEWIPYQFYYLADSLSCISSYILNGIE